MSLENAINALVSRLETVTARLEQVEKQIATGATAAPAAGGAAAASAGGDASNSAAVAEYESLIDQHIRPFVEVSKKIAPEVGQQVIIYDSDFISIFCNIFSVVLVLFFSCLHLLMRFVYRQNLSSRQLRLKSNSSPLLPQARNPLMYQDSWSPLLLPWRRSALYATNPGQANSSTISPLSARVSQLSDGSLLYPLLLCCAPFVSSLLFSWLVKGEDPRSPRRRDARFLWVLF